LSLLIFTSNIYFYLYSTSRKVYYSDIIKVNKNCNRKRGRAGIIFSSANPPERGGELACGEKRHSYAAKEPRKS